MSTTSGNVTGQETMSSPQSVERETLRSMNVSSASCTVYSVQAVAGVGTAGCARAGVDYGRRA